MKLFFRKEGSGPPLIVLHGLYGASDNWITIAKQLAKQNTIYLPDQRNHGRSPFANTHSYNNLKDDLHDFVNQQEIEKATLLGHSMGGKVAMWFAAHFPERTEKLIVADIAPKNYLLAPNDSSFNLHRNILLAMQEINFEEINSRNDVDSLLEEKIDDKRIRQFLLKNIVRDANTKRYKWRLNVPVLYNYLDEIVSGVNQNQLVQKAPVTNYPVTFIRGINSNYILPEDETIIKNIYPESKIIDIQNSGHWLHAEQPVKFIEAVNS